MIPILYKSDEVDFYDNGLGALTEIYDVDVQEQRNGLFTLTASYPVSGQRYKDIEVGRIIYAKPNQNDDPQAFRIVHTELDISGYALTIEADHITYDLTHNLVKSVHLQGNGQNAMTHLQEATVAPHLFRFISDLQHEGDTTLTMVNPMEAIAGTQGSILQVWGGELKRDNRTVSMLSRRGRNNFTSFRLGKNINGLKYTVDTTNLVTRIVPSVQRPNGNENELIIGDIVDSKNVGNYPNYYMQHVDVADNIKIDENNSDDVIKGKINAYAKNWFTQSANSKIDLPEVTVEIDVTSLQESADYQDKFKNLEAIELTDSVTVYVPEFGVNVQAIVNELHYDTVAERVTSIVIGTSKLSFADANANTLKELGSSINKIRENAVTAIVSANGKNTNYYGTEEPAHPVEGDLWFKSVGDETYLMIFKDGRWQEWVSTKTQDIINKQVDDALASAKEYTDELNEKQAKDVADFKELVDTSLADAKKERDELSQKADDMLTTANKYSDDIYTKAVANAKEQATSALSSANSALSEAKSDLTTAINQEISDRNEAVQTVNSQAQDYAEQAKSEAIEASKTADGVVRKDFKTTTDSLSSTITQNKKDVDGKISTAQSTATQALDGLKTKVSQTDYNTKTGQLQTDLTATTQTANQAKLDIASIKSEADTQSAQINDIVSDAKGTKQTVSDLKTEQGKQSGSIATLQSRADGFDASITKINDFVNSQGQVNQLMNTEFTPDLEGWDSSETSSGIKTPYRQYIYQGSNMLTFDTRNQTDKKYSSIKQTIPFSTSGSNRVVSLSWWSRIAQGTGLYGSTHIRSYDANMTRLSDVSQVWNSSSSMTLQKFENVAIPDEAQFVEVTFAIREGYLAFLTKPMFVYQSTVGDYVQGNYNNNGALAKVKLTADKAALDLSNYQKDADGRINKAQADITATANEVKTKVSQSDYDAKTGDLTTKYGQVKATADAVTTDVANYKKSNDSKVSANTANITANAKAIALKVSQTDFDATTKDVNTKISNQQVTVDKISQSVTELQAKANAQGQVNQLINTEFTPDLQGWLVDSTDGKHDPYRSYLDKNVKATTVGFYTLNADTSKGSYFSRFYQSVPLGTAGNGYLSLSWQSYLPEMADGMYGHIWIKFHDKDGNAVYNSTGSNPMGNWISKGQVNWQRQKMENIEIPQTAIEVTISFETREGIRAYLARPMLVFDDHIGDYAPGQYNNNARVSALELDVNGIHGTVNDPNKGLSATWNLANNGQTIAVQAQKDATTAITTAKGIQTQVTSNDGDIKKLQSTTSQTANQLTTEITDRTNGDKSVVTQMTSLIDQRVSSVTNGYQSAISQSADKIMASVSTPNQLFNTDFSPDLEGWNNSNNGANGKNYSFYRSYLRNGATVVGINIPADAGSDSSKYYAYFEQDVAVPGNNGGTAISMSWDVVTNTNVNYTSLWIQFKDANKNTISNDLNVLKYWNSSKSTWEHKSFDNVSVPKEAKYIRISFQAREGTNAYLSRPMLTFTSTAQDYMPGSYSGMNTSTVLELFKDNWALGITDNAGRIISGINGDTSGTVIQGKKLVINSDTTINGKAFIDGSVIKDASIGTAQIGKAAIGSAQIINVDVSKISGNIANFITANVDTLNARVLYGDTGHLGTTDTGRIINKQDNHLQLSAKGFYDSTNDRAQLELLGNSDSHISDEMKGSLNYYGNPTDKGHGLGIRMKYNQILAIDEDGGSKNLYLSPYAGGQVRIVSRDLNSYYDIAAANFRVSSQRKFKSDIKPLEDGALDIVNKTNIKSYVKNGVSEIGVIADEAPDEVLSDDGKFINIYDYTSVLYKAVQELSAQVKELQNERPNN